MADTTTFCVPQKKVIGNKCIAIITKLPHISKTLILETIRHRKEVHYYSKL